MARVGTSSDFKSAAFRSGIPMLKTMLLLMECLGLVNPKKQRQMADLYAVIRKSILFVIDGTHCEILLYDTDFEALEKKGLDLPWPANVQAARF